MNRLARCSVVVLVAKDGLGWIHPRTSAVDGARFFPAREERHSSSRDDHSRLAAGRLTSQCGRWDHSRSVSFCADLAQTISLFSPPTTNTTQ